MKKFCFRNLMAMAAIAFITTFTACGGDDDGIPGSESSVITIGTVGRGQSHFTGTAWYK